MKLSKLVAGLGIFVICLTSLAFHATVANAEGKTGVIVVDVQGDFTTWKKGSLAVNGTDKAFVEKVQRATETLSREGYLIFGTQDWHPSLLRVSPDELRS